MPDADATRDDSAPRARAGAWRLDRRSLVLLALSALSFGLSFPLAGDVTAGWPLAFVWPGLLGAAAVLARNARALASWSAAAFGLAFLAHEWWMHEVTVLGMPVLVAYLAGWMALLAVVIRRLAAGGARPLALVLPIALVAIEFLRGDLVCTGYAWFFAAHPIAEWPLVSQLASLGGGWLLSAFVAATGGAAADLVLRRPGWKVAMAVVAIAWGGAVGWGLHRLAPGEGPVRTLGVVAVQTNLATSNKIAWEPEAQARDFVAFAELTARGVRECRDRGGSVDLVLWPETTLPGLGLEPESLETLVEGRYYPGDRYAEGVRALASEVGAPLLVGSPAYLGLRVDPALRRFVWDRQFNSAYLVSGEGPLGRTDKIFLTPFGETMPVISNWDWLEERLLDLGASGMTFDLEAASRPERFLVDATGGAIEVGVPICFEITAPWASRRIAFDGVERRAEVLVNLSNDGWFAWSDSGRRQHLQVACIRAAELATPVVRCANTGISAWIDANGRLRRELSPQAAGTLAATPVAAVGTPPSVFVGDLVAWGALAACVVGFARPSRMSPLDRGARQGGHR